MSTAKRSTLTIQQRLNVLEELKTLPVALVAARYKVHQSTIRRIKLNAVHINPLAGTDTRYKRRKRLRRPKYEQVEKELSTWFKQRKTAGESVSDALLSKKAKEIKDAIGCCSDFKVSPGWLAKFKERHNIRLFRPYMSRVRPDKDATTEFINKFKTLIEEDDINLQNIYNMDTSSLLWKALPTKTLIPRDEPWISGNKPKKESITIALCTNATGKHKLDPLVIHDNEKLRALQNYLDKLLIVFKSQRNVVMNQNLFIDWYNNHFKPSVKKFQLENGLCGKIILLLDDYTGHKIPNDEDEHFKIIYLPSNTIALIQPMDQGIMKKVKRCYRHKLMKKAISHEKGIQDFYEHCNIKDCINMLSESWGDVTKSDIKNAWSKLILEYADEPREEEENVLLDDFQVAMSTISERNVSREDVTKFLEERLREERYFMEEAKHEQEGEDSAAAAVAAAAADDDDDDADDDSEEEEEEEETEEEEDEKEEDKDKKEKEEQKDETEKEKENEVRDEEMDIEINNETKTEIFEGPKDRGIALNSENRKELEDIFRRLEHFNSQVSLSTRLQLESVKLCYLGEP